MTQSLSCLISLLFLICSGCGSSGKTSIEGTAKLTDGSPVVNARITARSNATGKWASGVTDQNGHFTLGTEKVDEGLEPGEYDITVVEDLGDWDHPNPPKISRKYGNPATSGLTLKVEPTGDQTLDLTLDPAN